MVGLLREAGLMGDADVDGAIRRRLSSGLANACIVGPDELRWRPIRRDAFDYELTVSRATAGHLERYSNLWNYDRDVLIATILADEMCKPFEVVIRERSAARPQAGHQVRREPGKGNIYPVHFMMPGYQLVFMRMLGGQADKALVLEEALVALARQVVTSGAALGSSVTQEAFDFAQKMVSLAARPSAPSRGVPGWPV